jgi:hypothetical protein
MMKHRNQGMGEKEGMRERENHKLVGAPLTDGRIASARDFQLLQDVTPAGTLQDPNQQLTSAGTVEKPNETGRSRWANLRRRRRKMSATVGPSSSPEETRGGADLGGQEKGDRHRGDKNPSKNPDFPLIVVTK